MKIQGGFFILCACLAWIASAAQAQTLPPLSQQQSWTEQDKKEFLNYLNSSQPLPTGQVKGVAALTNRQGGSYHMARALEFGPSEVTLFPFSGSHYGGTVSGLGGRLIYEQHFVPWLRGYAGLEVDPLRQTRLGGVSEDLTRWAIPAGLEFALVPLSTPQTRYVLLRLGVVASDVYGSGSAADFATPLMGASAAWNLGLGYEWQFADSNWRLNAAVDGLRSMGSRNGTGYYGLGTTLTLVRTF